MLKNKKNKKYSLLLILLSLLFITTTNANADDMNFSMSIKTPENQVNKDVTYFDLLITPSEKQKLEVIVTNLGGDDKKMRVTPTNAFTNSKGNIDYNKQEEDYVYDKSLKTPFTSLVSKAQVVDVKPGESKTVIFDFEAPKEGFEGIILGGFITDVVDDENSESETNKNVTFINKFQMIKAVVLRGEKGVEHIAPAINLNEISPALYSYRTAVTANLQNESPIILKDVTIDADIYAAGSKKVLKSESRKDIEFAPNSNFDFPIMWNDEPLRPGEYTLKLSITIEGKKIIFDDKDFEISKEDSYQINEEAMELKNEPDYLPWIIAAVSFILIIITTLVFIIIKEKRKSKNKKRKNRHR